MLWSKHCSSPYRSLVQEYGLESMHYWSKREAAELENDERSNNESIGEQLGMKMKRNKRNKMWLAVNLKTASMGKRRRQYGRDYVIHCLSVLMKLHVLTIKTHCAITITASRIFYLMHL